MATTITKIDKIKKQSNLIILAKSAAAINENSISADEKDYISKQFEVHKTNSFDFNRLNHWIFVRIIPQEGDDSKIFENARKSGNDLQGLANKLKLESVTIVNADLNNGQVLAFAEGMALGNYQFIKYFNDKDEKRNTLNTINIYGDKIDNAAIDELNILIEAVCKARDLVNEPVSNLNAVQLGKHFQRMASEAGIKIEVFNKKKIESLKMGGLLAVNIGSEDPPTFTVMEWAPQNALNEKPLILVGKGVTYDTGGLNIKTGKYMENMKSDMSGAAMMAATIYAAAKARIPLHIIALIPATDNRLNGNAYAPGDIIKMHNGLTVEIINTDAEGRMILADALSYAQKYDPELVINAATLTGSAQRAIGKYGVVAMHTKANEAMEELKKSGNAVYERVAEFPFWDEYADMMKSPIADLVNAGPPEAGMITAGKFLEKFTDYPFIHLDIAGVAFAEKRDSYRSQGGTGFGVRLLFDFLKKQA
jgi:leucyl aminopeptidase